MTRFVRFGRLISLIAVLVLALAPVHAAAKVPDAPDCHGMTVPIAGMADHREADLVQESRATKSAPHALASCCLVIIVDVLASGGDCALLLRDGGIRSPALPGGLASGPEPPPPRRDST